MSKVGDIIARLMLNTKDYEQGLKRGKTYTNKFAMSVSSGLTTVIKKFATVAVAVKGLVSGVRTIADFERANSQLASVLGTNADGVKALTDAALELGRTTEFTASQVTGLQTELARLGFNQSEILGMQEGVLKFAAAVDTDLSSAAARAGATMRGFGLTAQETTDMLSVMAVGTTKSALSFEYLDASLGKLVPITKTYGLNARDTIALLGTLANAGIDASSASTGLKNILMYLADSSSALNVRIGHTVKTMPEIIAAFKKLHDEGLSLSDSLALTDKRAASVFSALINGIDGCDELYGSLQNVNGMLEGMYTTMTDNVTGSIKALQSAWEGLILAFSNSKGAIKWCVDELTRLVTLVTDLAEGKNKTATGVAANLQQQTVGYVTRLWKQHGGAEGLSQIESSIGQDLANAQQRLSEAYTNAAKANNKRARKAAGEEIQQWKSLVDMLGGASAELQQRLTFASSQSIPDTAAPMQSEPVTEKDKSGKDPLKLLQEEAKAAADMESEINAADEAVSELLNSSLEEFERQHNLVTDATESYRDLLDAAYSAAEQAQLNMEGVVSTEDMLDEMISNSVDNIIANFERFGAAAEELSYGLQSGLMSALDELSEQLYNSEGFDTGAVVKALLSPLADAAIAAGTIIMTTGEGIEALKAALIGFAGGSAVLAGAALIAVGAGAKIGLAAIGSKSGAATTSSAASGSTAAASQLNMSSEITVYVEGKIKGSDIVLSGLRTQQQWGR